MGLSVCEQNIKPIRFYERNGFCKFATHVFVMGTTLKRATPLEDKAVEEYNESADDTTMENSADVSTSDLQRTLESIVALMGTKDELPTEKFYSITAIRYTRRVGS